MKLNSNTAILGGAAVIAGLAAIAFFRKNRNATMSSSLAYAYAAGPPTSPHRRGRNGTGVHGPPVPNSHRHRHRHGRHRRGKHPINSNNQATKNVPASSAGVNPAIQQSAPAIVPVAPGLPIAPAAPGGAIATTIAQTGGNTASPGVPVPGPVAPGTPQQYIATLTPIQGGGGVSSTGAAVIAPNASGPVGGVGIVSQGGGGGGGSGGSNAGGTYMPIATAATTIGDNGGGGSKSDKGDGYDDTVAANPTAYSGIKISGII